MKIDDLPIYKDARGATLWVLDVADKFPKKHKFTLGDRIISQSVELLDEVIDGCKEYDTKKKFLHFSNADKLLVKVDTKILLSAAKQCITNKELGEWLMITDKLKKQLSGLTNSLARRSGASLDASENLCY